MLRLAVLAEAAEKRREACARNKRIIKVAINAAAAVALGACVVVGELMHRASDSQSRRHRVKHQHQCTTWGSRRVKKEDNVFQRMLNSTGM